MRIISKFHDFYDSAQGYGIDPKLIYIRKTEEIDTRGWRNNREVKDLEIQTAVRPLQDIFNKMPRFDHKYDYCSKIIAFCGKVYPFYRYDETNCYQLEDIIKKVEKNIASKEISYYDKPRLKNMLEDLNKRVSVFAWMHDYGDLNRYSWNRFCQEAELKVPDSVHIFFKSPILLLERDQLTINPQLKQYGFATQVDPFTAFQELSMYLGNNLVNQMNPEVNISDKLRAESKGFDKWSFRKEKKK